MGCVICASTHILVFVVNEEILGNRELKVLS